MCGWSVGRVPSCRAGGIPSLTQQELSSALTHNLNWCGCATTPWADPNKQTMGYSGRCSQGTGDYYTKYKDLATQICNRA